MLILDNLACETHSFLYTQNPRYTSSALSQLVSTGMFIHLILHTLAMCLCRVFAL